METSFKNICTQLPESKKNDGANKTVQIRCPFKECSLKIIPLKCSDLEAKLVDIEDAPETVYVDPERLEIVKCEKESRKYYRIDNAWDFDNIGVSKATEDIQQPKIAENAGDSEKLRDIQVVRYLVCPDCERGPLGFAGIVKQHREEDLHESNKRVTDANSLVYFLGADSGRYYLDADNVRR